MRGPGKVADSETLLNSNENVAVELHITVLANTIGKVEPFWGIAYPCTVVEHSACKIPLISDSGQDLMCHKRLRTCNFASPCQQNMGHRQSDVTSDLLLV